MAEWDAAYINDLPDSAFAVILPGGEKDEEGKTTPRSLRKLPHHNAAGDVDMPHLRNALSRAPQSDMPQEMHSRAESHLQNHMESESRSDDDLVVVGDTDTELVVRSLDAREIEARIVTWGEVADSPIGLETFQPGAFAHVDPRKVVLRLEHQDPPAGRGTKLEERSDGAYMTFRVSKTLRGDEILTLADDGVTSHVSLGYAPRTTRGESSVRNGKRVTAITRADLREVSTTWHPYYQGATVLAVRSEGVGHMAEAQEATAVAEAPVVQPQLDLEPLNRMLTTQFESIADRIHKIEERSRQDIVIPPSQPHEEVGRGRWMKNVLRVLSGETVSELEMRAMADLVTGDNLGVVPEAFSPELIGVIQPERPFLETTTRVPTPDGGMTLNVPVLETRPTVGVQTNEKDDITSTTTSITSTAFDAVTIAGGGDISLQLLRRSSPSYLDLYLRLLGEAMAQNQDSQAIAAMIAAGLTAGTGTLDPESLTIGEAWTNARAVRQRADTIWLSSAAVAKFINAKADGTNMPLYGDLVAGFNIPGGAGGTILGLRPVYVPALDATAIDVLVGPSRGFAWSEDGAFTLQVDVPSKAGRDVALVTINWFAPLYPDAFTTYAV